jgi:hypothetical protein
MRVLRTSSWIIFGAGLLVFLSLFCIYGMNADHAGGNHSLLFGTRLEVLLYHSRNIIAWGIPIALLAPAFVSHKKPWLPALLAGCAILAFIYIPTLILVLTD